MSIARRMPLAWLIPRADEPGRVLASRIKVVLTVSLIAANLIGAAIVAAIGLTGVVPLELQDEGTARAVNLAAAGLYFLVFTPLGSWWGLKRLRKARSWLEEDRTPTEAERKIVLRGPRRIVTVHVIIWTFAAILFGALNFWLADDDLAKRFEAGLRVWGLVVIAGLVVCAFVYLIAERQLRPAAARALAAGVGDRKLAPGIKTRILLPWIAGSALPILGLVVVGISTLVEKDFTRTELAILILVVGTVTLVFGALALFLSARAIADPIVGMRRAAHEVERGDLDARVDVYDGSEIGQLQAGFNEMVEGLRERERIQDLFGRHVGEEVARTALDQGIELGGEVREVAVLFTDVVGSTTIAAERPPEEVVELLNRFFTVVVEVIRKHGGWVNKFEGDAALAVFGAPTNLEDPAAAALAAGRELAERLPHDVEGLEAAIGVSAGEAVAGNIGEESRFEYTVIGDPVNEAARLTELAKEKDGRLLASGSIVERAGEAEAGRWQLDGSTKLRGRSDETRLAVPLR
ncbi:MAG TPA: adenylate/guanylate cyclase domain-containing protein [Solirubrobacterales bacterium]|nr:adenylate/guanylate cyclase domain-containing protein [Solirubrobacterales bacterium]